MLTGSVMASEPSNSDAKRDANIKWFRENLLRLLQEQPLLRDKYVVVYDEKIASSWDTFEAALRDALETCPRDEFAVQRVIEDGASINFVYVAR